MFAANWERISARRLPRALQLSSKDVVRRMHTKDERLAEGASQMSDVPSYVKSKRNSNEGVASSLPLKVLQHNTSSRADRLSFPALTVIFMGHAVENANFIIHFYRLAFVRGHSFCLNDMPGAGRSAVLRRLNYISTALAASHAMNVH